MKKIFKLCFLYILLILSTKTLLSSEDINYTRYDNFLKKLEVDSEFKSKIKDNTIILLQVDKLTNYFIDKKYDDKYIVPHLRDLLNKNSKEGIIYFENYYEDAIPKSSELEFSIFNSLYPHPDVNSINRNKDNNTFELPKILSKINYETYYLYASKIYDPEKLINANIMGFKNREYLGADNNKVFSKIEKLIDGNKKFIYASTDFNSSNIEYEENNIFDRLTKEIYYLRHIDKKIFELINKINSSDYKITLVIYGTNGDSSKDPNIINDYKKIFGEYKFKDELNMPLIIKSNSKKNILKKSVLCSSIDIMPTILHLIGKYVDVYPMMGEVLFKDNLDKRNIAFQNELKKGSFFNGNTLYRVNKINESYNIINVNQDTKTNKDDLIKTSQEIIKKIDLSNGLCDLNILKEISDNYYKKNTMNLPFNKTIMHAGGALNGISYSNLKEALDYNYSLGKRYFEIDFEKTSDNKYVALHSWDGFIKKFFDINPVIDEKGNKKSFSYKDFMNWGEVHGYTQMDVKSVMNWLNKHNDAYIITDCKGNNLDLLKEIKLSCNDLSKVIVQIYSTGEYIKVKNMGFNNIIFTLYRKNITEEEVIKFCKHNKLFAVTIEENRYKNGFGKKLINNGIKVCLHTINNLENAKKYIKNGVNAVYTDIL